MSYLGDKDKMKELKKDIIHVLNNSSKPLSYRQIAQKLDVESKAVHELLIDLVEVNKVNKRQDWLFESVNENDMTNTDYKF